jgi:hypothetical protein
MISEFTEFSYGFAVTHELVLLNSGNVVAAPEFPSLIREGQAGGGYDVRLNLGTFLFLQFKLSEYMYGRRAQYRALMGLPYYRFWITPRWRSSQHRMLVELANTGQQVYYAAPTFHLQTAFNAEFQANTVVNRSAFINPAEIGYLTDDEEHCVVLNSTQAYFCSEPKKLWLHTGGSLKEFLSARMQVLNPTSAIELAVALNRIISEVDERVPLFRERTVPQALDYISFVAHVFLHSEVFFVPASTEQTSAG